MTVLNAMQAKYGQGHYGLLCTFGGDPDSIVAYYESLVGQTDAFGATITIDDLADDLYNAFIRAIEAAYFARIDRTSALAIYSALRLTHQAQLTIFDGMEYNNCTFDAAWSKAHPSEHPLNWENEDQMP